MAGFSIWGNMGNTAYAVPMVKLTPVNPATQNQVLAWHATDGGLDYTGIEFDFTSLDTTFAGNVNLTTGKTYKISALQVVGPRRTGWGTPTGTATRTAFDPATVTLPQLAERVKALIDDLTAHGLIGA